MLSQRHILEMVNGVWAIITLWLSVFLIYHLVTVGAQRRLSWDRWLFALPTSMQLAFGVLVAAIGICISRATVWFSRASNDGFLQLRFIETGGFLTGSILGAVGFLCVLRVVTRAGLGNWPWLSAVAVSVFYVAFMLIRFS